MATTPQTVFEPKTGAPSPLQEKARRHLWMHFTRMGAYDDQHEIPIIVRGEGSYVYDEHGNRYLDGLSALFCVNAGHGRAEIGDAAAARPRSSASTRTGATRTRWRSSLPSASRASPLATSTACSSPRAAPRPSSRPGSWRASTTSSPATPTQDKIISRETAYHGTTFGALSITGITPLRTPFEPLVPGAQPRAQHQRYRWPEDRDPLWAADQIEHMIEFQGPETVAAVILEPVQNSGGCFVPQDGYWQRVREICDRHGVLLVADEVICSWGRLGHYFGVDRFNSCPTSSPRRRGSRPPTPRWAR